MNDRNEQEVAALKQRLGEVINKVPYRVQNGGIIETREWVSKRKQAVKLLKGKATASQLISAISSLQ